MPVGDFYGCEYCGRMVPPSQHDDLCPVRIWKLASAPAPSALEVQPMAEGTVRGSEAVVYAKQMLSDAGKTWDLIPRNDQIAMVQHVILIVRGAEVVGWKFKRPEAMVALREAPFLIPTRPELHDIASHIPDYDRLKPYPQAKIRASILSLFAVLSQHGWGVLAPDGRRPTHEGGFREQAS